jgi:hypothetical protein
MNFGGRPDAARATISKGGRPMKNRICFEDLDGRETCSIEEAGRLIGISRGLAYASALSGELPVIQLGNRRLCSVRGLRKLLMAAENRNGDDTPRIATVDESATPLDTSGRLAEQITNDTNRETWPHTLSRKDSLSVRDARLRGRP